MLLQILQILQYYPDITNQKRSKYECTDCFFTTTYQSIVESDKYFNNKNINKQIVKLNGDIEMKRFQKNSNYITIKLN